MLIRRSILMLSCWQLGHLGPKYLFEHAKIKFYKCFNAMMCKARNSGNELVCVHLFKSMCLLIIFMLLRLCNLVNLTIHMFNAMVDRAVFRMFGCASAEDIKYTRYVVNFMMCYASGDLFL